MSQLSHLMLVAALVWAAPPASAQGRQVGAAFPPLRLPTIDGKRTIDMASLRGKKVLLIEFASW